MAVGAGAADIARLVLVEGARTWCIGAICGALLSLFAVRYFSRSERGITTCPLEDTVVTAIAASCHRGRRIASLPSS